MDIPLKSQLLKSFEENDDVWEDDAFNALLSNENISSEQWKWHCRFWLSEMTAAGLLEITDTEPGFKGDTATGATKPATVETGAVVNVPLFVDQGDKIKIDTRTGEYLSRV